MTDCGGSVAKNRYRYDASGRLTGYSSDRPPLLDTLRKWLFWTVVFFGILYVVGGTKKEDRRDEQAMEASTSFSAVPGDQDFILPADIEPKVATTSDQTRLDQSFPQAVEKSNPQQLTELTKQEIEIAQAIQEAFSRGEPVRWSRGYA